LPNIKAAEKWAAQSEKRTTRNKAAKSRLKTLYRGAANASGDGAPGVESAFDKAASKGIIHRNKAARAKARLAKALRRNVTTTAAKSAKPRAARAKK